MISAASKMPGMSLWSLWAGSCPRLVLWLLMALRRVRVALMGSGLFSALAFGCVVSPDTFACSDDTNCSGGRCESNGYCSFPTDACPSGQRFSEHSGPFSGECVPTEDGTDATDPADTTGTADPTDTTGTTDPTDTTDSTDTTDPTSTTDPADPTDPTDPVTTGPSDPTTSDTTDTSSGDPDGSNCAENEQCQSGFCYLTPLGGVCGECASDGDCNNGGCNLPNPLVRPAIASTCNTGTLGGGCQTNDVCSDGLSCVEIINVPGILTASTCSECASTDDCGDSEVCNLSLGLPNLTGEWTCVPRNSVEDGEFCDFPGDGDDACANFCAEASIKGVIIFGVCGECNLAGAMVQGCEDGESCVEPEASIDGTTVPSVCAP